MSRTSRLAVPLALILAGAVVVLALRDLARDPAPRSASDLEIDRIALGAAAPTGEPDLAGTLDAAWQKVERKRAKLERQGPKAFDAPQDALDFFLAQRLPAGVDEYPIDELHAAREALRVREAAFQGGGTMTGDILGWSPLGPGNVGGRTRALVIDPNDPDVMFAAGVAGGVWKSVDGGASWNVADDLMLNLAVTTIAMDPTDSSVLYAGTGEGYFAGSMVRGLGIFKSVDSGTTWTQLAFTVSGSVPFGAFHYVNDVVVSPNDSNRVYAATRTGVWRSPNAGVTWAPVLLNPFYLSGGVTSSNGSFTGCTELAIRSDVGTDDTLFAACGGTFGGDGLWRTTDNGASWTQLGTASDLIVPNQGRMSLALARSDQDVLYVCMADNASSNPLGQLVDVFRTDDGGNTWSGRVDMGSPFGPWLLSNLVFATGCATGGTYSQGWYDNVIAVDPTDPDVVWVGGVDLFRSDDGAQNFGLAAYWFFPEGDPNYVHPDHHAIVFHPGYDGGANQTMYFGNDGGLYRTTNSLAATSQEDCPFPGVDPYPAIVFETVNNGYGVTQFYHGDSAKGVDVFGGGCQDNGTNLVTSATTPNGWSRIFGGDGGYFAIDHTDPLVMYAEIQFFPEIRKSTDGGASFDLAIDGITDTDGLFIAPFAMDPNDAQVLWTGGSRPWRTVDGAGLWSIAANVDPGDPGDDPFPNAGRISAIAVAPSDSNVVYLGFDNGWVARTTNGLVPVPTWTESGFLNGLPAGAYMSSVAVAPHDPDVAYATYSTFGVPHVYETLNGGATWASIDGIGFAGVPEIPVHWLEVRPTNPDQLYVGTELGVFASDDRGSSWDPVNIGLANTVVESLDFQDENTLIAFTHGRGAFRAELRCSGAEPVDYCTAKTNSDGCLPFVTATGFASESDTNPFQIRAHDVVANQGGLLIYGASGRLNLNFHNAKLCVKSPLVRLLPPKSSGGSGPCGGMLKVNFNNRIQSGADPLLTSGQKINGQWIYRDPTVDSFGDGLTNGIEFSICP